jgi:chromosome segregation ATPase
MPSSRPFAAFALLIALAAPLAAKEPAPKPDEGRVETLLNQMAEAQKWVGEELWKVKEKVEALPATIADTKEGDAATLEEVQKLRDEVKGLYVEISDVKEKIESLRADIDGVNTNVSGFRTYSGFFLALMLLMVAIVLVMTIRR